MILLMVSMHKNILNISYSTIKSLLTRKVSIQLGGINYQVDKIPLKKLMNWLLNRVSVHLRFEKAWGFPTQPVVEPSNLCNLYCAVCPVGKGLDRPGENLNFNIFKKFIDEIGDYVFSITLYCWGEPFLNPAIFDMIVYLKTEEFLHW